MPESEPDEHKRADQRRDAYDKVNTTILALTLMAAGTAAFFTYQQAATARDQERRALRAYVIAKPVLLTQLSSGKAPFVQIGLENMGQTPAYDVTVIDALAASRPDNVSLPIEDLANVDCRQVSSDVKGITLSHTANGPSIGLDEDRSQAEIADITRGSKLLIAYGTVCYSDVFKERHSLRFCFRWFVKDTAPEQCPGQNQGED